jgi:hypothetical protein
MKKPVKRPKRKAKKKALSLGRLMLLGRSIIERR